jgi:catechol 2,3-dioxygenase-like lactoylglutathione lyase family enzyme
MFGYYRSVFGVLFSVGVLCLLTRGAVAQPAPRVNWIRQFGTATDDIANRVSVDGMGGVYVAGSTGDWPAVSTGHTDAIVAKYDAAGNAVWTRQFGVADSPYEGAWGVSADRAGNVFVSGWGWGSVGGPNPSGAVASFITEYNSSGTQQWTRQVADPGNPTLTFGVSADGQGNAYISGHTEGSLGGSNAGSYDAYLAKYDGSGNRLWCRQFGTATDDSCRDVSADGLGNIYVTGFTAGALGGTNAGGWDAFVVKYDSAGSQRWVRQFGTADTDEGWSVSADRLGNVFVGGVTGGSLAGTSLGGADALIAKYDSAGNLAWTRQFGTASEETIWRISADGKGNIYVAGSTTGALAGPAPDPGFADAFVAEYDADGNRLWITQIPTRSYTGEGWGLSADGLGNVYLSGSTYTSLNGTNAGGMDAFVASISSVPEPSTFALLGVGVLALAGYAWRRRGRWLCLFPGGSGSAATFKAGKGANATYRRFAVVLAALCLVFSCVTTSYAVTVTVTADPLWTNTGVVLSPADSVLIHDAAGDWSGGSAWTYGPAGEFRGPAYWYDEWVTDGMHGELIGAVVAPGLNLNVAPPRALPQNDPRLFAIGTEAVALTGKAGVLWLGFNDDYTSEWNQSDNFGTVAVQVDSVPEPSTLALLAVGVMAILALAERRWKTARE